MRATYDEYFLKGNWLDGPLLLHKPLTKGPFFSAGPFLPDRFFPDRFYPDRFTRTVFTWTVLTRTVLTGTQNMVSLTHWTLGAPISPYYNKPPACFPLPLPRFTYPFPSLPSFLSHSPHLLPLQTQTDFTIQFNSVDVMTSAINLFSNGQASYSHSCQMPLT